MMNSTLFLLYNVRKLMSQVSFLAWRKMNI